MRADRGDRGDRGDRDGGDDRGDRGTTVATAARAGRRVDDAAEADARSNNHGFRSKCAARRPFFRRRKTCPFSGANAPKIDYKDIQAAAALHLRARQDRAEPHHRGVRQEASVNFARAIKRARFLGLLPYVIKLTGQSPPDDRPRCRFVSMQAFMDRAGGRWLGRTSIRSNRPQERDSSTMMQDLLIALCCRRGIGADVRCPCDPARRCRSLARCSTLAPAAADGARRHGVGRARRL